jgi:hypothetical protein
MAFKEYTSCVKPPNYVDFGVNPVGISNLFLLAFAAGLVAFAVIAIAGGPVAITIAIALVTAFIVFLLWWLNGRLICLPDDTKHCAIIGMVLDHGPSDPAIGEKYGDNDYTMNLMLARGPLDLNEDKQIYCSAAQGELVAEHPAIHSIGKGYPQSGGDLNHLKALHCEFEGDGIRSLLDAFYAILAILIAALWISGFLVVVYLAIAFILALLALDGALGAGPGGPGAGTPLDIDPSLGSLDRRDVVVVTGEWIYDSGHAGWNEIHPVRDCQIIGRGLESWDTFKFKDQSTGFEVTLDSDANFQLLRDFWCGMLKDAHEAEEKGSRDDPVNGWGIHPLVDGCKKPIIIL